MDLYRVFEPVLRRIGGIMSFVKLTALNSGIVSGHIRAIHDVCQYLNTFLFVRPSEQATMRLIAEGFATKSMDIHDKSSNWGLASGFVPIDQAFSKNLTGQPNAHLHAASHGLAKPVHLTYSGQQFGRLLGGGHFEHTEQIAGKPCCEGGEGRYFEHNKVVHMHSTKLTSVCLLWERASGKVYWRARNTPKGNPVPMMVWGYAVKGTVTPVTGDYDMWMVAPHVTVIRNHRSIGSIRNSHGRSAASAFAMQLTDKLNIGCKRSDNTVFNHGAEAQNYSFTQGLDRNLAAFAPGAEAPFLAPREAMPQVLHDLLRHGYVVTRNPKWINGSTMGIEDMADALKQAEFQNEPMARAGRGALDKLERSAATLIQRQWRQRHGQDQSHKVLKPVADMRNRAADLAPMRAIGNMPADMGRDTVLPLSAFPMSTKYHDPALAAEAIELTHEQEAAFGRKGFTNDGGHAVPVDRT